MATFTKYAYFELKTDDGVSCGAEIEFLLEVIPAFIKGKQPDRVDIAGAKIIGNLHTKKELSPRLICEWKNLLLNKGKCELKVDMLDIPERTWVKII